jgi:hypothetical protein
MECPKFYDKTQFYCYFLIIIQIVRLRFGAIADFLSLPFVRFRVQRPAEIFFTLQALMPEKRLTPFSRQHVWLRTDDRYFRSRIFERMTRAESCLFA